MGLINQTAKRYYDYEQIFIVDTPTSQFTIDFNPLPQNKNDVFVFLNNEELFPENFSYSNGVISLSITVATGDEVKIKLKKSNHGNYRYISIDDIVANFMVSNVGDDKIITTAKHLDVLFHAKRAIQEFSYDISRVEKIQEIQVGDNLTIPMPQDYVNYVQLSWVDENGLERIIYPTAHTSRPSESILQDDNMHYLYDENEDLVTGSSYAQEKFKGIETSDGVNKLSVSDYFFSNDDGNNNTIELGKRFGLNPETTQTNGLFVIDEVNGQFGFSSDLASKIITIKYISDGLGTDSEMKVHKLAEEAIYKYIGHAIVASKANMPEYIVNRFKRERRAAMRNAKLRLSNLKLQEMSQVMRGKSKQIKH